MLLNVEPNAHAALRSW